MNVINCLLYKVVIMMKKYLIIGLNTGNRKSLHDIWPLFLLNFIISLQIVSLGGDPTT